MLKIENLLGVFEENLFFHGRFHRDRFKIGQPAFRGQVGMVGPEQAFVLQKRIGVLHQRGGKIFRRPAGKVQIYISLVHGHRQHFFLPGPGGVGSDDGQFREIGREIINIRDRTAVFQADQCIISATDSQKKVW
mgnify:CR=1 FL=1